MAERRGLRCLRWRSLLATFSLVHYVYGADQHEETHYVLFIFRSSGCDFFVAYDRDYGIKSSRRMNTGARISS